MPPHPRTPDYLFHKKDKTMSEIKNLNPACIWKNFYALTQVPRPSGHLEKIQQFLLDFGKEAGVEVFKDPANNIVPHGHGAAEDT